MTLRHQRTSLSLMLAATWLAACQAPPVANQGASREAVISADVYKNVTIDVGGRRFNLRAVNNQPLGDMKLRVGGMTYETKEGRLQLSPESLQGAKSHGGGFFWIFSSGFVPKQVWLGQTGDEILLVPLQPLMVMPSMLTAGGTLSAGGVSIRIPDSLLRNEKSTVALSGYEPPLTEQVREDAAKERAAFLAGARARAGVASYAVQSTPGDCTGDEQPLPSEPSASLGMLMTVGGPIGSAPLTVSYDLDRLLDGGFHQGRAADRILKTFDNIDRLPDAGCTVSRQAMRDALAAEGLSYDPATRMLTFTVDLAKATAKNEAQVQTHVASLGLLGVHLEVTLVSVAEGAPPHVAHVLPGIKLPTGLGKGGTLIGNATGNLIGNATGNVIGAGGGNLIGNATGNVIGAGGGNLIGNATGNLTGQVRSPFANASVTPGNSNGKYQLLAFTDNPAAHATVRATDAAGNALCGWVTADANGVYVLEKLKNSPAVIVVEARSGAHTLRTFAPAPGALSQVANVDAATTSVAGWLLGEIQQGTLPPEQVSLATFLEDVEAARPLLTQDEAKQAVASSIVDLTSFMRTFWASHGLTPDTPIAWVSTHSGSGSGHADGPGATARFNMPTLLTPGPDGHLYVADSANHCIRRVAPDGSVSTFVGMPGQSGHADGPGATAKFNWPRGLSFDKAGNLYVADIYNHCIRKITPTGQVSTLAGAPKVAGYADGTGAEALFKRPSDLAVDADGSLLVVGWNPCVRRVSPTGAVTTVAGSGTAGHADGQGAAARMNASYGITHDGQGRWIIADAGNHVLRRLSSDGTLTTIAGQPGVSGYADGASALFATPAAVAVAADGTVFIGEMGRYYMRRLATDGTVATVLGTQAAYLDGPLALAQFSTVRGMAIGDGLMYVADRDNHRIRAIRLPGLLPAPRP